MAQLQTSETIEAINHWVELFDANLIFEAENAAQIMVQRFPENATCWHALSQSFHRLNKIQNALLAMTQAFELKPTNSDICGNVGLLFNELGDVNNAQFFFQKELALNPKSLRAHYQIANFLTNQLFFNKALFYWEKMVQIEPLNADVHANYALALLRISEFEKGWSEYRWVYHPNCTTKGKPIPPRLIKPEWQGESFQNKTIIILPEQGLGDFIQFVRYSELLKNLGATVWVAVSNPLIDLFKTVPWIDRICGDGEQIRTEDYDFWSFFMALPHFLKTNLDSIPCNVPYLLADEKKSAWWEIWFEKQISKNHKRVGLVWAGNPTHSDDTNRSISFSQLAAFSGLENVTFVSLQLGEKAQKEVAEGLEGVTILDASAFITDFSDSAALLKNLDLLITVDSAPAHLAGALNFPVWVMIPAVPDWRWLLERDDSPWYPSMRLFRQSHIGDWTSVLADVKTALEL
jgi:ADP-heptose:LPS heptosyltransferase/Tfp pilus assembly protein PilF